MKINAQEYLKNLTNKSVWVFTKQETNFNIAISATKLFDDCSNRDIANIESYFSEHHLEYGIKTNRHRVLVIPQFLGLITKTPFYKRGYQYCNEKPTAVFDSFNNMLKTKDASLKIVESKEYNTLKTEQILKLKIHAIIDTAKNNDNCYILPVIFIYKVLKELQQKYKINQISIDHLYTYVMTCKNHSDYINAVEFIKNNGPISKYVQIYKQNSRVLTLIKKILIYLI